MLNSAINWLSWACGLFALVFMGAAFSAIRGGDPDSFADVATVWSGYLIFLLGAALMVCIMIDQREEGDDEKKKDEGGQEIEE